MINKKLQSVGLIAILGLVGVWLLMQSGSPASETVQRQEAMSILAPNGQRIVEVQRDFSDTSQSAIQAGHTAAPGSFEGNVRDLPQVGPEEKGLGVEFEFESNEVSDIGFIDPVRQETVFNGLIQVPAKTSPVSTWPIGGRVGRQTHMAMSAPIITFKPSTPQSAFIAKLVPS